MKSLREARTRLLSWKRCSQATQHGYEKDFQIFSAWCREKSGREPMPCSPDTLELFVLDQLNEKGFKVTTVSRRVAAIKFLHKQQGHKNPVSEDCRDLLVNTRCLRREQQQGKKALDPKDLVKIAKRCGKTNRGVRNRAMLVFGFASGLRRSEIARLNVSDVLVTDKGVSVNLAWSKTDQTGAGRIFGIFAGERACTDPVRTMRAWLDVRGKASGPLFTRITRKDEVTLNRIGGLYVNRVVHHAIRGIGLDPADYGAHSLRSGLVTAAAANGATDQEIMRASGHKSPKVMQKYVRPVRVFAERNPLAGVL